MTQAWLAGLYRASSGGSRAHRRCEVGVDPWDYPEWHGFNRETSLAAGLVCAGVNSLGRANYADLGDYYVALFGLSNGIERLGKLIWVADFRTSQGRSPTDAELRKLGHKLPEIVNAVRDVDRKAGLELNYPFPDDHMTEAVLDALTMFADASRGRYANFETIGGASSPHDPVTYWWSRVVEPILATHFDGTARQERAERDAGQVEALIGEYSMVRHLDESGGRISDVRRGSYRSSQNALAQTYGRFYTLRLVRWMSEVFAGLTVPISGPDGDPALFGHHEIVRTFIVSDKYLRTRKRWPL